MSLKLVTIIKLPVVLVFFAERQLLFFQQECNYFQRHLMQLPSPLRLNIDNIAKAFRHNFFLSKSIE